MPETDHQPDPPPEILAEQAEAAARHASLDAALRPELDRLRAEHRRLAADAQNPPTELSTVLGHEGESAALVALVHREVDRSRRREWAAAAAWIAGRIDMELGTTPGWKVVDAVSVWASLIAVGELSPWVDTPQSATQPAEPAVEAPADPGVGTDTPEGSGDESGACCDLHGRNCEPPGELCCVDCTEAGHPFHPDGVACTWASKADVEFGQAVLRLAGNAPDAQARGHCSGCRPANGERSPIDLPCPVHHTPEPPSGAQGLILGRAIIDRDGEPWPEDDREYVEAEYPPVTDALLVDPRAGRIIEAALRWRDQFAPAPHSVTRLPRRDALIAAMDAATGGPDNRTNPDSGESLSSSDREPAHDPAAAAAESRAWRTAATPSEPEVVDEPGLNELTDQERAAFLAEVEHPAALPLADRDPYRRCHGCDVLLSEPSDEGCPHCGICGAEFTDGGGRGGRRCGRPAGHHGGHALAEPALEPAGYEQRRAEYRAAYCVQTTDNDMQAFAELPDCEACDGCGKRVPPDWYDDVGRLGDRIGTSPEHPDGPDGPGRPVPVDAPRPGPDH